MNKKFSKTILLISTAIITLYSLNYNAITRDQRIDNRLKPIGEVHLSEGAEIFTKSKPKLGKDAGLKRYKSSCYICHDTGASGAPKIGDKSAWTTRLKQSKNSLYDHAVKGYNAMPAKGGCLSCSDEEIKLSVDYMLQKSN